MLELSEPDLIAFFGVLPEARPREEQEFFDAPLFVKTVGSLTLTYCLSFHFKDLELRLAAVGAQRDLLECQIRGIETLRVESDARGRLWLRARSTRGDEVAVAVDPSIAVSVTNHHAS